MKIVEIDNKRFYGKELPEQNIIILFKIPSGATEANCEAFFKEILDIINDGGDDLYSSDIVSRTHWDNDAIKTIGESLYVVRKGEHVIVPEGLNCVFGKQLDELFVENKLIAKIQTDNRKGAVDRIVAIFCILSALVILLFILFHDTTSETNTTNTGSVIEINTNEQGYSEYITAHENTVGDVMEDVSSLNDDYTDEISTNDNMESNPISEEHLVKDESTYKETDYVVEKEFFNREKQHKDRHVQDDVDQKFNSLVSEADELFRKYYDGHESAARHAIEIYDRALKIKYNSMVSKRREMLKQEIE